MRQFRAFVLKEFYHIVRDRWTMLILLGLPVVMLILFGYAITTEVKNTRLAVYDPSKDVITEGLINKLQANEYFIFSKTLNNPGEVEDAFRKNEIGLAVVFSNNFYENLVHTGEAQIQLVADGTDPNTAKTLVNYATNIINSYRNEISGAGISSIPYSIKPEIKLLYNPGMKGAYNFVPGVMGMILMLICAMMTSVSIAREKETGTMEVLLVSPMKPIIVIISKVVPYFVISCINLATILLLSIFVIGVPVAGNIYLLIGLSLLYIFVSLSLGLLISSVVETQVVALLISAMVLMLPVLLLSGMLFPIENMPWALRTLSQIIPAKWFIIAVKNVMIKGLGVSSIVKELIILGGMAMLLISVSLRKFKTRLD